jgi:hypothetical protein
MLNLVTKSQHVKKQPSRRQPIVKRASQLIGSNTAQILQNGKRVPSKQRSSVALSNRNRGLSLKKKSEDLPLKRNRAESEKRT